MEPRKRSRCLRWIEFSRWKKARASCRAFTTRLHSRTQRRTRRLKTDLLTTFLFAHAFGGEARMSAWSRRGLTFAGVSVLCLCALGASLAKPQGQQSQPQQTQAQQNQTAAQQLEDSQDAVRKAYADEVRKSYNFRF